MAQPTPPRAAPLGRDFFLSADRHEALKDRAVQPPATARPTLLLPSPRMNEQIAGLESQLNDLIGLHGPKNQIRRIRARVNYRKVLSGLGVPGMEPSMDHYVFRGPPGTGKTTFARMIGTIYKHAGLLKNGNVVECGRVDLVAPFVGQTAPKTHEVVKRALGGVLFVDEAYGLYGTGNDFGKESLEVILKAMEIHKSELVVVFAGYPDKMDELLRSNPGLSRRFKNVIDFDPYTIGELMEILDVNLKKRGLKIDADARDRVRVLIEREQRAKPEDFGNAGTVENIADKLMDELALTLDEDGDLTRLAAFPREQLRGLTHIAARATTVTTVEVGRIDPKEGAVSRSGYGFIHHRP